MRNRKTTKKSNMEPGDATDYEAQARSYFDSLRRPFEQTLEATRKNHPQLVVRISLLIALIGVCALPFTSTRVATSEHVRVLGQVPHNNGNGGHHLRWCLIGCMVGLLLQGVMRELELKSAAKPLSAPAMVFALSYAILRDLENYERSKLPHHRQTVIELWGKLLTYLRWLCRVTSVRKQRTFTTFPRQTIMLLPKQNILRKH